MTMVCINIPTYLYLPTYLALLTFFFPVSTAQSFSYACTIGSPKCVVWRIEILECWRLEPWSWSNWTDQSRAKVLSGNQTFLAAINFNSWFEILTNFFLTYLILTRLESLDQSSTDPTILTAAMAVPFSNTKLRVPQGFQTLLEMLSREILRDQPQNIYEYSAKYLERLVAERG